MGLRYRIPIAPPVHLLDWPTCPLTGKHFPPQYVPETELEWEEWESRLFRNQFGTTLEIMVLATLSQEEAIRRTEKYFFEEIPAWKTTELLG